MSDIEQRHEEIASSRKLVPAENLRRLVAQCETLRAAGEALGVSGSAVGAWIKADATPLAYDLAAQLLLAEGTPAEPPKHLFTAVVSDESADAFAALCKAIALDFTRRTI